MTIAKNNGEGELVAHPDILDNQIYWKISNVNNIVSFQEKILESLNDIGFSDYSFYRLNGAPQLEGGLLSTLEDVMVSYQSEGFAEHDIMLMHANSKNAPLLMSSVENHITHAPYETEGYIRYFELIRLCRCYGFNDFYNIPFDSCNGKHRVAMGVSAKNIPKCEFQRMVYKSRNELTLLAQSIDYVVLKKFPNFFVTEESTQVTLSPRPLQLLQVMVQKNLLLKQAAYELHIGIDTANKHMATIKSTLGAATQASAVYRAIEEGLIECNPRRF